MRQQCVCVCVCVCVRACVRACVRVCVCVSCISLLLGCLKRQWESRNEENSVCSPKKKKKEKTMWMTRWTIFLFVFSMKKKALRERRMHSCKGFSKFCFMMYDEVSLKALSSNTFSGILVGLNSLVGWSHLTICTGSQYFNSCCFGCSLFQVFVYAQHMIHRYSDTFSKIKGSHFNR